MPTFRSRDHASKLYRTRPLLLLSAASFSLAYCIDHSTKPSPPTYKNRKKVFHVLKSKGGKRRIRYKYSGYGNLSAGSANTCINTKRAVRKVRLRICKSRDLNCNFWTTETTYHCHCQSQTLSTVTSVNTTVNMGVQITQLVRHPGATGLLYW